MSGRRLARPSRPIFMPRLNAAFGSVCDRKPASATPPETNVWVLSERSPSRNAGHRKSATGRRMFAGGSGIVETATSVTARP